ncbi:hypothetical protein B0H10DRAFT_2442024 [Mycena sp. CBHHK59/15]|nr:hypothetical protein B0H10DRAFT_2442024 [Mycena sp. CBHHK59/15]
MPSQVLAAPGAVVASSSAAVDRGIAGREPKMTATTSLTPRNLCAREWISKYHGTRPAFTAFWNNIVQNESEEEERWNKRSVEAKASAQRNSALATA